MVNVVNIIALLQKSSFSVFRRILSIGVSESIDSSLRKKITLTNFVIIIFSAFIFTFSILFYHLQLHKLTLLCLFWGLTTPLWLLANYFHRPRWASLGLLIETNLMGFIVCWRLGQETQFHLAYIAGIAIPILLFGASEWKLTIGSASLTAICYTLLQWMPENYIFKGVISPIYFGQLRVVIDTLIITVIFVSVFYLSYLNEQNESQLNRSVVDLEESYRQLEKKIKSLSKRRSFRNNRQRWRPWA